VTLSATVGGKLAKVSVVLSLAESLLSIRRSRCYPITPGKCFPNRHHGYFSTYYNVLFTATLHQRSQWPRGLRRSNAPLAWWHCAFESHRRYGSLSLVNVVYCIGTGLCDGPIPLPEKSYRVCHWVLPGAMVTLFIYSEKAEEVGLRQLVLQAAANEQLGKVFSCSQEPVDQWGRHLVIQMCWRSGATAFGDARRISVTCVATGCYRVTTNIWLELNLNRPTNLWRAQEIKKQPVHNLWRA
jgi:hypothetical protein